LQVLAWLWVDDEEYDGKYRIFIEREFGSEVEDN
jgi:hypothetical protein